jgi:hypothetical protein
MKEAPERAPVPVLVDAVLGDLAVRSAMYVARRREDGDAGTCVIQTGEEGRLRLVLPDVDSDTSVMAFIVAAQTHLEHVLGVPVPLCRSMTTRLSASLRRAISVGSVLTGRGNVRLAITKSRLGRGWM